MFIHPPTHPPTHSYYAGRGLAMAMERSYIMVKPDGVQRGLVGEIIARFERKGYKYVS